MQNNWKLKLQPWKVLDDDDEEDEVEEGETFDSVQCNILCKHIYKISYDVNAFVFDNLFPILEVFFINIIPYLAYCV